MPGWGEILGELQESAAARGGSPDFDGVRRKYLKALHDLTKRPAILYATAWLQPGGGHDTSIALEDMQGFMEVCRGVKGPSLDLILHSPGGSPEAAASIVNYLRQKFSDIRVFVPLAAMSAATMWALACDEIVMGKHSQLGPIDPQLVMPQGAVPARAIIQQFDRAVDECRNDPSRLAAWVPILQQYGPALLQQCEAAERLAKRLVQQWLSEYMLKGQPDAAAAAAEFFGDFESHQSHSLGISREVAKGFGLNIGCLEDDQDLQDAVLSVHHATLHTLTAGAAVKLIENHLGSCFAKIRSQVMMMPMGIPLPGGMTPPMGAPLPSG